MLNEPVIRKKIELVNILLLQDLECGNVYENMPLTRIGINESIGFYESSNSFFHQLYWDMIDKNKIVSI